ncbi:MAG: 5-formyltetrahydrofolate cyclo-ligase [Clostridia bacterium]|nr:5-formyltetrahydrofolate cyclo-ligase [Clostridia bacterium]
MKKMINMTKQELRSKYIAMRNHIAKKNEKSKLIFEKVICDESFEEAKVVALYKSLPSEVDTTDLIKYSLANGKVVLLPRVVENELQFYRISDVNEALVKSEFGVEEPAENVKNLVSKSEIDLAIVPGVCFDTEKNRLGFGKGFYDRFLWGTSFKTIAICFDEQMLENAVIPASDTDVKMQKIITDKKTYF